MRLHAVHVEIANGCSCTCFEIMSPPLYLSLSLSLSFSLKLVHTSNFFVILVIRIFAYAVHVQLIDCPQ